MTDHEKEVTERIKAKIMEKDPTAEVILFGSHARGDANKDSDWDILILVNIKNFEKDMERAYRDPITAIEVDIEESIQTIIIPKDDWESRHVPTPFYQNIKKQGILLT
jgi:predicted nucleotidyltransferase